MANKMILLVDDNLDDVELTMRALTKNHLENEIIVMQDGAEALDFLFCTGDYADRDPKIMPEIILLDLRLPKVDGLEVLRRMRAQEQTRFLPVVILTSSNADRDLVTSHAYGANAFMRKPVDFIQFVEAVRQLGLHLVVLNHAEGIG